MGISLRIFIVDDNDSLQRFPLARYDRLLGRDPKERIPQYANKRIRYALVVVSLINRRPVEILKIEYSFLSFDPDGMVDPADIEREARLAFDILPSLVCEKTSDNIIDARYKFAKRRFQNEYEWSPSSEIKSAIFKTVFGND
jgi:hypothetical protein